MDKIYINLSPKEKKKENALLKNVSYYISVGIFLLLVVLVCIGVLIGVRASVYKYEDIKWAKWREKYIILSKIKQDIKSLENDRNEFEKMLTPKNQIPDIFEDVFSSLPKNIWFSSMNLKKNTLDIRGYVVKVDEDYLVSLE
ncbi:MAG: hypothetical protein PHP17_06350, partial [Candidatus Omnitrophica bacterium]|nr:hypothetical protein [Candidatus Omnitrophota bacterium]